MSDAPERIWVVEAESNISRDEVGELFAGYDESEYQLQQKAVCYETVPVEYVRAYALTEQAAEIDRLREALAVYSDPCDATETGDCGLEGNMCCMTARAALSKEPTR